MKAMVQTPNAHAVTGPEPRICESSKIALVIGKKTAFCARIRESDTSSMEKLKANSPPTTRLAVISGSVMRRRVRSGPAPRFRAAFSS